MKYFTIEELCRSNTATRLGIDNTPNEEEKENLRYLVEKVLDPLREWFGNPIYVNSGFRNEATNKAVGGVKTSWHLKGCAADIDLGGKRENLPLFNHIKGNLPFTELGWEGSGRWIHVAIAKDRENDRKIFYA